MKKTVLTGVIALFVFGFGTAAASPHEAEEVSVSFADLNIQNEAGARVLYARLKQASKRVCHLDAHSITGTLIRSTESQECYVETLDSAVAKIDSAALRKIHSS